MVCAPVEAMTTLQGTIAVSLSPSKPSQPFVFTSTGMRRLLQVESNYVGMVPTSKYSTPLTVSAVPAASPVNSSLVAESSSVWRVMSGVTGLWAGRGDGTAVPRPLWSFVVEAQPKVNLGSPTFHRSLVVTISPRFVVINATRETLLLCQSTALATESPPVLSLAPGQRDELHWTHSQLGQFLAVSTSTHSWSGPIDIGSVGETAVRLRAPNALPYTFASTSRGTTRRRLCVSSCASVCL